METRIDLQIESAVTPADRADVGFWIGRSTTGRRYSGCGVLARRVSMTADQVVPVPDRDDPLDGFLIAALVATGAAFDIVERAAAVWGPEPLVTIMSGALAARGIDLMHVRQDPEVAQVIDVSADPLQWQRSAASTVTDGTLMLVIPPWVGRVTFNFYPHVHRRSLRVVTHAWNLPRRDSQPNQALSLLDALRGPRAELWAWTVRRF